MMSSGLDKPLLRLNSVEIRFLKYFMSVKVSLFEYCINFLYKLRTSIRVTGILNSMLDNNFSKMKE